MILLKNSNLLKNTMPLEMALEKTGRAAHQDSAGTGLNSQAARTGS